MVLISGSSTPITQWAAWIGACTGVASLAWNVYLKVSAGPKLRVKAFANNVKMPPPPGNPYYLRGIIQNVGNSPTTITNYGIFRYTSRWQRLRARPEFSAVLNVYEGSRCPVKLDVGGEANVIMEEDGKFRELLATGQLWFAVYHSFGKRPVETLIPPPNA